MKQLAAVFVLIVTLLAQVCLAAISVDATGSFADGNDQDPTTLTGFTVANQANRILIATYGAGSNTLASSMTFNGDALTNVGGADVAQGANNAAAGIYYRVAPDIATGDEVLNFGANRRAALCAIALYGADQSSPITDSDETSGTTETSATLTLTTVAGDYVVYAVEVRDEAFGLGALDHTAGTATGETEVADVTINATIQHHGCSYAVASGSSLQIGYSWNVSTAWALAAVTVHPSSSASGVPNTLTLFGVGQ